MVSAADIREEHSADLTIAIYTYVAGCTDPFYEHSTCPNKRNYTDYQWVGLTFCTGEDKWVGCENDQSATPSVSKESSGCTCDLDTDDNPDEPIFEASKNMVALGTLPKAKGEKIEWFSGWGPSYDADAASSIAAATSSSSSTSIETLLPPTTRSSATSSSARTGLIDSAPSSTSTAAATTTGTLASSTAAASDSGGLSVGEKAGIGVSVVVVSISGLGFLLFVLYRWLKKRKRDDKHGLGEDSPEPKPPLDAEPTIPDVGEPDFRSPAWSGYKSELPGSPTDRPVTSRNSDSASTIVNSPSWSSMPNTSPKHSSEQPVYRPFRYQPSKTLEGIQEMPDHERPRWAQTEYGTYGPSRGYNPDHDRLVQARGNVVEGGSNNVHELPG